MPRLFSILAPLLAASIGYSNSMPHPAPADPAIPTITTSEPASNILLVDDFPGADDREKINAALAEAARMEGPKTLRFQPRTYLVRPVDMDTFEPVLGSAGARDLTIEGNGAVWVAQDALNCRKGYFFKMSRFENLTVKDLTLTYRPTPFVQGIIVRCDQARNRTTLALQPGFDHINQLKRTPDSEFWCRVGLADHPTWPKPDAPSWMSVGAASDGSLRLTRDEDGHVTVDAGRIDPGLALNPVNNWQPGDPIVIWKRAGQDGFAFEEGVNLRLENIRVENALHFAIKVRGVSGAILRGCAVAPGPGAMLSSCADGIDIQQSRTVRVESCTLVATGDDSISFLNHRHGFNGENHEAKFPPPYPETNADVLLRDNRIEGGNRNGILLLASDAKVLNNTVEQIRQYGLKFAGDDTRVEGNTFREVGGFTAYRHIADELDTGVICSDEWIQSNIVIRHNVIEDWHHMPGLLIKALRNARVEGNIFTLRDPGAVALIPNNSYLDAQKAIVVTHGNLNQVEQPCADISIFDNVMQAAAGWETVEQALFINGKHARVTQRGNRVMKPQRAGLGSQRQKGGN